jgi:two-component system response regulator PilR (NtrC family)
MTDRVLIVDDEPDIRELLEITLGRMSLITESTGTITVARELVRTGNFNLCLTDMRLPDGDGIHLVEYIQSHHSHMPVAVITAHGNTETAVRALKAGAFDFVSKPIDLQKLRDIVHAALKLSATSSNREERIYNPPIVTSGITGTSSQIVDLRRQIWRLARSQAPVFISGESGSGKELAARAIHQLSARADAPFIAVNCGAIPDELMESELFGHVKGSFTGADKDKTGLFLAASGGTLFLDEVADLPLHMQVKLLRVIQEKSVRPVGSQTEYPSDVRILSASHKNLAAEVQQQNFRQDLYYRINVIELSVPSLRDRSEDIPELALQLLQRIADENKISPLPHLSKEAIQALCNYSFPGNVRELENILQRALTLCDNHVIFEEHLDLKHSRAIFPNTNPALISSHAHASMKPNDFVIDSGISLEQHLESIERSAIEKALVETRWNQTAAAEKLGMSFRSLRYRLKKLGLK